MEQQYDIRRAFKMANILSDPSRKDADRLQFVSEGEAAVHFALELPESRDWLRQDVVFGVLDAGGSTVDSTLYRCVTTSPGLVLEELTASECIQAGGIYVDRQAEIMLERKLKGSNYSAESYRRDLMSAFEKTAKRKFDGTQERTSLRLQGNVDTRENDPVHGIYKGYVHLTKEEVAETFDAVVPMIIRSVRRLFGKQVVDVSKRVSCAGDGCP